jgi:lipoprotein-releasing system permease protein
MASFPQFIAQRIGSQRGSAFARFIARIAIGSVAIGMAAAILSSAIFQGFRHTIQEKIFSFSGHVQLSKYNREDAYEVQPVPVHADIYRQAGEIEEVAHIQRVIYKAGLLKTDDEVMGLVFKGVGTDFDTLRFYHNLVEGRGLDLPDSGYSSQVLLSRRVAEKMRIGVGSKVLMYFVQDPPKYRMLEVCGLYDTGIEDFDDLLLLGDYRLLQRINNWGDSLVGGFEVFGHGFEAMPDLMQALLVHKDYYLDATPVTDKYGHLFDWFFMINQHIKAILAIILSVAAFNIISVVLIMIIERTEMIGTLKALGASSRQLRRIFLLRGFRIAAQGLLWGNGLGIGLAALQQHTRLLPLDPANYYMDAVPVLFHWPSILLFNAVAILLVLGILLVPTFIIARISPIKAIKFD